VDKNNMTNYNAIICSVLGLFFKDRLSKCSQLIVTFKQFVLIFV